MWRFIMKKFFLGLAALGMAITLAACGSKTVATTSGGKITQDQYYSSLKVHHKVSKYYNK